MTEVLRQVYRSVLIQIADDLTVEQYKQLLFYCKGSVSRRDLSISQASSASCVQIFDRLEDARIISCEDLSFLAMFLHAIGRLDLVTKLTALEITRELTIYVRERNGPDPSLKISSTTSIGSKLAEMMELARDRADVAGLICTLFQSGKKADSILDAVAKSPTVADVGATGNWSAFALLVAIAAEIVLVASYRKAKARGHLYKYSVDLATELGNHLSLKLAKIGSWVSEL